MNKKKFKFLNKVDRTIVRLKVIRKILKDILDDNVMYDYEYDNLIEKLNGFEYLLLVDFAYFNPSNDVEDFNRRYIV